LKQYLKEKLNIEFNPRTIDAVLRRRAFAALVPPAQLPLSQGLEASVVLPGGLCAVPGPMRLYSYQRAIADSIGDPDIERVTLQKAARIGFSVLVAAAIGHYCGNDPAPILCPLPTESDCRDFMTSDIEPMFAASHALQGVLRDELMGQRGRRGRNTILSRQFPGGSLKIVAAKSPRNLRRCGSHSVASFLFTASINSSIAAIQRSRLLGSSRSSNAYPRS
jgi:phage terminase large subunit GpA-like protein